MALRWNVEPRLPDTGPFADELRRLWNDDPHRSPFAAPELLAYLAQDATPAARELALACGRDARGVLRCCVPLYLHRDGSLRLLHYRGSDQSGALVAEGVQPAEIAEGIAVVLAGSKASSLFIDRLPPGSALREALELALPRCGWSLRAFDAAPNPCLRVAAQDGGAAGLLQRMRSHKKFDYFERRLRKETGYVFEALRDDAGLEQWVREFCDSHDWSWGSTDTPSVYRNESARADLLARLQAWATQGVLVRFSLRTPQGRPAFAVGLLAPGRLVYHHVTISPAYAKHSAGHVLLRHIAEWMADNDLSVLDFGVGDEDYKQRYANTVDRLWRVYGARSALAPAMLRARVDAAVRAQPALQRLWNQAVNGALRGRVAHRVRTLRQKLHTMRAVHLAEPLSTRVALVREKLTGEQQIYFIGDGRGREADPAVRELPVFEVLSMLRREQGLPDGARAGFYLLRSKGWIPYGIVEDGQVVQVCWIGPDTWDGVPASAGHRRGRLWCIRKCVTARAARGRGLYARVLSEMLNRLPVQDEVIIYTQPWNIASQRGIERAGFRRIGRMVAIRGTDRDHRMEFLLDPSPTQAGKS